MDDASSSHIAYLALEGIDAEQQDLDEIRMRIREEFSGWSVWRARRHDGRPGSWCATRNRLLTSDEMYRGLAHTLVCDDITKLHEELTHQARCEEEHTQP